MKSPCVLKLSSTKPSKLSLMSNWPHIQSALDAGELVLLPTETVYGIAARADRPDAITKIYALKGRYFDKPCALCVRDIAQAKTLAKFDDTSERLARKYWPGSLTLVLNAAVELDPRVTDETQSPPTVALRCPDADWRNFMDAPLALTSANRSGEPDSVSHEAAINAIGDGISASLTTETKLSGAPSTIIRIDGGQLTVLRQGALEVSL